MISLIPLNLFIIHVKLLNIISESQYLLNKNLLLSYAYYMSGTLQCFRDSRVLSRNS